MSKVNVETLVLNQFSSNVLRIQEREVRKLLLNKFKIPETDTQIAINALKEDGLIIADPEQNGSILCTKKGRVSNSSIIIRLRYWLCRNWMSFIGFILSTILAIMKIIETF